MTNYVIPLYSESHPRKRGEFQLCELKKLFDLCKKFMDDTLMSNGKKKAKELLKKCLPVGKRQVEENEDTALLDIFQLIFDEYQLELCLVSKIVHYVITS